MPYYQGKREGIMLCYPFEEKRLEKWGGIAIVQPKLDGVRCRAVWQPTGSWILLSSQLNEIISVPHINQALHKAFPEGGPELDGELYTHGLSFEQVFSATSRTRELHADSENIELHIFDLIKENTMQTIRLKYLRDLNLETSSEFLKVVPDKLAVGAEEVMTIKEALCSDGYEGIIVRKPDGLYVRRRSTEIMKFKPKKSDWYRIVGVQEEVSIHGELKASLGALICSSDEGETFNVGTGFTRLQREELWEMQDDLLGKWCHVEYQHITPGRGVPRFPVFVRVVDDWKEEKEVK